MDNPPLSLAFCAILCYDGAKQAEKGAFLLQDNETLRLLRQRRSIRRFRPDPIGEDALRTVLEAALYAPYASPDSRHITAIQNRALLDRLDSAAKAAAARCGEPHLQALGRDPAYHCFYRAPVLTLLSGSRRAVQPEADCAAAAENLLLAAAALGLGSCWLFFPTMAFFGPEADALRQALRIPEDFQPYAAVALGMPAETPDAPARDPACITVIR